jgi:hypothetical protein
MTAAVESLQPGPRVRVDAPCVPEFASSHFAAPGDADGVTACFLADDGGGARGPSIIQWFGEALGACTYTAPLFSDFLRRRHPGFDEDV